MEETNNLEFTDNEQKNIEVVYRLNDLVNNEKYNDMDELFNNDYIDHNPGWEINNLNDLKEIIKNAHKDFNLKNQIKEVIAKDDKVFVHVINNGEHIHESFGIAPTGKKTKMDTFEIYRIEKGKIAERWVISDITGLMKQLGIRFPF